MLLYGEQQQYTNMGLQSYPFWNIFGQLLLYQLDELLSHCLLLCLFVKHNPQEILQSQFPVNVCVCVCVSVCVCVCVCVRVCVQLQVQHLKFQGLGGRVLWPECNMLGYEHWRDGGPGQNPSQKGHLMLFWRTKFRVVVCDECKYYRGDHSSLKKEIP